MYISLTFYIQNMEIVVPIRDDGNGNPDWSTIQEVFWIYQDVVCYLHNNEKLPTTSTYPA